VFVGNLRPDETVDADHEAKLLRNLNHAGIVRFYDSFVEAEFFCIVTEFCDVSRDLAWTSREQSVNAVVFCSYQ